MTISAWINSTAFPRDDAAIVSSHDPLGYQLDTTVDQIVYAARQQTECPREWFG